MDLSRFVFPVLHRLDPERAHNLTIWGLKHGFGPVRHEPEDEILRCSMWNLDFPNPIGISAGFDKNAEVFDPLLRAGFGFVEVGTVTPWPQAGNEKPRLFRLREDGALINRMGFNNDGLDRVLARLSNRHGGIVGVNMGANKDSADTIRDYASAASRIAPLADYMVANVSSPNTPGLRILHNRDKLEVLIDRVQTASRDSVVSPPPFLVKIAPDLADEDERDIADIALAAGIDGLIVSNSTIHRPNSLLSEYSTEGGGLTGRPLFDPSTQVLRRMYERTEGRIPLIGVGGVASGGDAYRKIRAGASLVQVYTALIYEGPELLHRILHDLADCLRTDGFDSVAAAVGADHR